ncbi:MAG: hypothetical protein WCP29_02990 [Acidobacteriota bacterium]
MNRTRAAVRVAGRALAGAAMTSVMAPSREGLPWGGGRDHG